MIPNRELGYIKGYALYELYNFVCGFCSIFHPFAGFTDEETYFGSGHSCYAV